MNGIYSMIFFSVVISVFWKRKVTLSLVKMMSLLWFFLIILYKLNETVFVPISDSFDFVIICFFSAFFSCYIFSLSGMLWLRRNIMQRKINIGLGSVVDYRLFYFVAFVAFLYSMISFINLFFELGGMAYIRESLVDNGISLHVGLSFPLCAAAFFYSRFILKKDNYFFLVAMFVLAVVSTSKIFVVLSVLYAIPWYLPKFKLSMTKIFIVCAVGFLFFSLIHIMLGKIAGPQKDGVSALFFTFKGYLLGSIAALQLILDGKFILPQGIFIDRFLGTLPFTPYDMPTYDLDDIWVRTGDWLGNVYTAFAFWYQPLGLYSILLFASILGVLYGVILSSPGTLGTFMKVYSYYPLIFMLFSEQFFLSVSQWLSFFCAGLLMLLSKNKFQTM